MIYTDPDFKAFLSKLVTEHQDHHMDVISQCLEQLNLTQLQLLAISVDICITEKLLKQDFGPENPDNQRPVKIVGLY